MKTIYRYEINKDINDVSMPIGAKILCAGVSSDVISIWAEIDTEVTSSAVRRFAVFGTGANLDPIEYYNPKYIGTVQKKNTYAFHVYEVDIK